LSTCRELRRVADRLQLASARVVDRVHDLALGLERRVVQRDRDADRKLQRIAQVGIHHAASVTADLVGDAGGEAAEPGGVEARIAARQEHEDQHRSARALLGDQQLLGRDRLQRDVADQVDEAVHREPVGGAAVAALDALERADLDQKQSDGPAAGEAGHDPIELLVRMQREHRPPRPALFAPARLFGRSAGDP
jgi:hypothetical protein